MLVVGLVIAAAVIVSLVLVLPNLRGLVEIAVTPITPVSRTVAVDKTSMGRPDAPVKMDVWEDFQCSGCLFYTQDIEPKIDQTYVETGKVYYTFHFFPFLDGGQGESHDAADAAMCASAQGRFWDYHDILFANWKGENVGSFTRPRLAAFAQNLGLNMTAFQQCFQANTYSAQIQADADAGSKLGVPPTPGIFVNSKMVPSSTGANTIPSFDDISHAIDAAIGG